MVPPFKIRNSLHLSSENELFIAICKIPYTVHSFIIVGVKDKASNQNHILCGCGKYFDPRLRHISFPMFKLLFSYIPGRLREENFLFEDIKTPISYKAFNITETQYDHFLHQLSHCKHASYLGAYHKATAEKLEAGVKYVYDEFEMEEGDDAPINQSIKKLSINSTCRHTAKELLNCGIGKEYKGGDIPSFFLTSLPTSTYIKNAKVNGNLFIFPVPPSKEDCTRELYLLLSRIYKQLERISKGYTKNENTFKKFQKLKDLYTQLDDRKETENVFQLFQIIESWEQENKKLIDAKRGFSLFRTTATRDMMCDLMEIKHKLR